MPSIAPSTLERAPADPAAGAAAIASVAIAVPERTIANEEIAAGLGVDPRWIVERTGVRERRIASGENALVALASDAASRALAGASLEPADVDLILAATMSHDRLTPNLAPLIAGEIGADGAGAIDVGVACTGFLAALSLAAAQVESGRAHTVVVVGADLMSRLVDPADRKTAALFADGAGAVVVRPATAGVGVGQVVLGSDAARAGLVWATRAEGILRMEGQDTFREAVDRLCEATSGAVAAAELELGEIDAFVYHQANARILRAVGQRLGLPPQRVVECISSYGNTSAASVPIALATAVERGALQPGGRALLAAFGGGLTWGATVIEWGVGADGD